MIIEFVMTRGLSFYIDGHRPSVPQWGFGGDELNMLFHTWGSFSGGSFSDSANEYIPFGDLHVAGAKIILGPGDPPSPDDIWRDAQGNDHDGIPRKVVLDTNHGKIVANVTQFYYGWNGSRMVERPEPPEPEPGPESVAADMGNYDPNNPYAGLEDADEFADEDDDGVAVELADGTTRYIDDGSVYIRAET